MVLNPETFDLGHDAILSNTYAHFMAPFLMAFAPAAPGKPHPGPWKAAKGGLYLDITAELFLPATTRLPNLDRVNTIWWITALLRLRASSAITVPVISSERFASIPAIQEEPHLWPIEIHTPRLFPDGSAMTVINSVVLEWVRDNWFEAASLLSNQDFYFAFQAVDSSIWNHNPALALVAVWGALERLFCPAHAELSFRVSANLAAYLEPLGRRRYICYKKIKGLYDGRSKAAHGSGEEHLKAYCETHAIARLALTSIIDRRHVPTKSELEANLFGDADGIQPGSRSEQ